MSHLLPFVMIVAATPPHGGLDDALLARLSDAGDERMGPEELEQAWQMMLGRARAAGGGGFAEAYVYQAMGKRLLDLGHFQEALARFEAGLRAMERPAGEGEPEGAGRGWPALVAKTLVGAGDVGVLLEDLYLLDPGDPRALRERASARDELRVALMANAGSMYLEQRQFAQARQLYEHAAGVAEGLGKAGEALLRELLANRAWLELQDGHVEAASRALEAIFRMSGQDALSNELPLRRAALAWAEATRAKEGAEAALPRFDKVLELYARAGDPSGYARALAAAGGAKLAAGEVEDAAAAFRRSLEESDRANDSGARWRAHLGLARVSRRRGAPGEALDHYARYLDAVQAASSRFATDQGRFSLVEGHASELEEMVGVALDAPDEDVARARDVVERVRQRSLAALLTSREQRPRPVPGTIEAERAFGEMPFDPMAMAVQSAEGAWAGTSKATFREDIAAQDGVGDAAGAAVFLEYFVLAERTVVFVVEPKGPRIRRQVLPLGAAAIEAMVADFRAAIGLRSLSDEEWEARGAIAIGKPPKRDDAKAPARPAGRRTLARRLYDALVAPVASWLPRDRTLVVVPHRALWHLPFAALTDPADGKDLIERQPIAYAVSRASWSWLAARPRPDRASLRYLLAGNPGVTSTEGCQHQTTLRWAALPGAEREVRDIAALLPDERVVLLTGSAADGLRLEAWHGGFGVLHLATHGLVCPRAPLESFVLVGPAEPGAWRYLPERGTLERKGGPDPLPITLVGLPPVPDPASLVRYPPKLTAQAVIDHFPLDADLVVLSGCQTGLGRITSEGVVGLSRAFLAAGARSLLVSQWSVNDDATRLLMVRFYEGYLAHGDKARALRDAMLATRASFPHPADWAAFTLVGPAE